jgi:hypothetical protein
MEGKSPEELVDILIKSNPDKPIGWYAQCYRDEIVDLLHMHVERGRVVVRE